MTTGITSRTFGLPRSLHAFGANALLLPLGIANSVLIARTVGPAGKGSFDLIMTTAALFTTFLSLSLPPGITYAVARSKTVTSALSLQLLLVSLVQGLLALLILLALHVTGRAGYFVPETLGTWVLVAIPVYIWVELMTKYWAAILTGQQHIAIVNNSEVIGRVVQFFLLFAVAGGLFLFDRNMSVPALFAVSFAATILINLLMLHALDTKFHLSRDTQALREAATFALPSYLANSAQFLNYRLGIFIVSVFAGVASVGRFTLAVSLAQLLWLLSNAAASVLLPKIAASSDVHASVQHTNRVTRLSLWASVAGALALGVFASLAIPLLYGEAFRQSIAALWCILPGVAVFSVVNILASYLAGIGRPQLNLLVSCASLVVTVALNFILIPKLDIVGASIASTASYSFSAALTTFLFVRNTGVRVRDVLLPPADDITFVRQLAQPFFKGLT